MSSTDLKLLPPGSIHRPGIIGRAVRLGFGVLCAYYLYWLVLESTERVATDGIPPVIWNGILPSMFLISYVVNIGFSVSFKKFPLVISVLAILIIAGVGYSQEGTPETPFLAEFLRVWLLYLYSHLGISFLLSSLLGTPGCEMRAIHDLMARVRGTSALEHQCPVGPISIIDKWEQSINSN